MLIATKSVYSQKPVSIREEISADSFMQKLNSIQHPQLIDVRTAEEYSKGHLKNALNIDVNKPDCLSQFSRLNKRKPTFVYCLAGKRGEKAADILQSLGFKEIYNMKGGIEEWINEGKPVVK